MLERTRLLIVDDEAPLLRLMKAYLERVGYEVDTCADAANAFDCLSAEAKWQAAILDLSLIAGRDDIIRLARRSPGLRVLVCSGSPFEVDALPADIRSRCSFLQKPFLPKMLLDAVEELLARTPA
ncbi:MAG TPA: response regulator [Bryobacteraceae bacterium]|nr:response regulator [Bryobacteraceae bacterium]